MACLTDDVEWLVPGAFHTHGKTEFDRHIDGDGFVGRPDITVTRYIEQGELVVVEGTVRTQRTDTTLLHLVFCDVFAIRDGRIHQLTSYLMATPAP